MDDEERLAGNLIRLRKEAGLTQAELAEKLGYSNKSVSKWERGDGCPDVFTLMKIADIYGVTVDEMLRGVTATRSKAEFDPSRDVPQYGFKRALLLVSCSALLCMTLIAFFLLMFLIGKGRDDAGNVLVAAFSETGYNYWVLFVYNLPLDAVACYVFLIAVHRRSSFIVMSTIWWGLLASIHLSVMQMQPLTALIYAAGAPLQILIVYFNKYLNIGIRSKEPPEKRAKDVKENER